MRRRDYDPSDDASFYAPPHLDDMSDEDARDEAPMTIEEHDAYWAKVRAEAGVDQADLPY